MLHHSIINISSFNTILILTNTMQSQQQIMENNLALLLSKNAFQEVHDKEPQNPFEKKLFDKKMRRSMVDLFEPKDALNDNKNGRSGGKYQSHQQYIIEKDVESKVEISKYLNEVTQLITKLQNEVSCVETKVKEKMQMISLKYSWNKRTAEHLMQNLLGNLEGSIEFIVKDCLNITSNFNPTEETQQNYLNDASVEENAPKITKNHQEERKSLRPLTKNHCIEQDYFSKQTEIAYPNYSSFQDNEENAHKENQINHNNIRYKDSMESQHQKKKKVMHNSLYVHKNAISSSIYHQEPVKDPRISHHYQHKSIYESVLEEREKKIRKSKKKMI